MSHWRSMFDNKYLGNWDLPEGRDVAVVMTKVEAGTLTSAGGRAEKKPLLYFRGKEKAMALNKTNSKTIAGMYGHDTAKWAGKPISIFVTQTMSPDGMVPCIRVRPTPPRGRAPEPTDTGEPETILVNVEEMSHE